MSTKPSICVTLTSPFVLNAFLLGHIARLSQSARITVCINRLESDVPIALWADVRLQHIEIRRNISPWHDWAALFQLARLYRREKFDVVWSITPKAGLLAMLAARTAGIPVRIHYFTGQVWATKRGAPRFLLKFMDRVLAACATDLLADSLSQRDFLIREGIASANRLGVIGAGSVSGVDLKRFRPDPSVRRDIRASLGIPGDAVCMLYAGRMKRDKGVPDLLVAFGSLRSKHPALHLLLVGPDEDGVIGDPLPAGVHRVGYTRTVESYMAAADIICLPSYREGFGTVLIEGAAAGLPAVASRIYGIEDAVIDGETGLLHPPRDTAAIAATIERLLNDPELRGRLAIGARRRTATQFAAEHVEELFAAWLLAQAARIKN